ncbi:MAG TPA: hypothetical protein VKZ49_16415 [Polyangiaceae bacterium]|nr:hypothetical protein [Polyangiaceae bacterium]
MTSRLHALVSDLADELAREIAARVVAEIRDGHAGMVDQAASPLGRRRHIALVRRLHAAGDDRAAIVGRTHYATRGAIDDELRRLGQRAQEHDAAQEQLAAELGIRLVGGRR